MSSEIDRLHVEAALLRLLRKHRGGGEVLWCPDGNRQRATVFQWPALTDPTLWTPRPPDLADEVSVEEVSKRSAVGDEMTTKYARVQTDLDKYRRIAWGLRGTYVLNERQAKAVRVLLAAYLEGRPDVRQQYVLRQAGSDCRRLADLFVHTKVMGGLVVEGEAEGDYRLAEPDDQLPEE